MNDEEFKPWLHQIRLVHRVLDAIDSGKSRRICASCPTGGGKTWVEQELARIFLFERKKRVSLYTNRKMMVEQISKDFLAFGLDHGIRAAGYDDERQRPFQISSIQTEHNRCMKLKTWKLHNSNIVLVDEGHLHTGMSSKMILDMHYKAGAAYVMFTATPLGMAETCDLLIVEGNNTELRNCGAITYAVHYGPNEPDMKAFKGLAESELPTEQQNIKAMSPKRIFGSVWEEFNRLNPTRRPTLLFGPGVEESLWYAQQFTAKGVPAAHIDGDDVYVDGQLRQSDPEARKEILEGSRTGRIIVICNRFVLREGINAPWLAHGIFATIFGSLQSYLQSGGRLLRAHHSLDRVTIQDHGGNWWRHGSLNEDRLWQLDYTADVVSSIWRDAMRNRRRKEPFLCPHCKRVLVAGKLCNPAWGGCGYVLENIKRSRPVVCQDGTLKEMTGNIFTPRRIYQSSNGPKIWENVYWRSYKYHKGRSFATAEAIFAYENNWGWPNRNWPLMPKETRDMFRFVKDVPFHRLTSVPESFQLKLQATMKTHTAAPALAPAGVPSTATASAEIAKNEWTTKTAPYTAPVAGTPKSLPSTPSGAASTLNRINMHTSKCTACKAPMGWLKSVTSGKSIPVDLEPSERGNIRELPDGQCEVLTELERVAAAANGEKLYNSHFATCAEAEKFRKTKPQKGRKYDADRVSE